MKIYTVFNGSKTEYFENEEDARDRVKVINALSIKPKAYYTEESLANLFEIITNLSDRLAAVEEWVHIPGE